MTDYILGSEYFGCSYWGQWYWGGVGGLSYTEVYRVVARLNTEVRCTSKLVSVLASIAEVNFAVKEIEEVAQQVSETVRINRTVSDRYEELEKI